MSSAAVLTQWLSPSDWAAFAPTTVVVFVAAAMLLGAFDITMPRGDAVGVSGVLDVVALVLFGPSVAFATCILGVVGSGFVRMTADRPMRLRMSLVARLSGLVVSSVVLAFLFALGDDAAWVEGVRGVTTISAYLLVELTVSQAAASIRSGRSLGRLLRGNISQQLPLILAQVSVGQLALIGYSTMREWSLVVVVSLLLLIRQSYALLLDIRETYRTTVEVLVEVAEDANGALRGHAERTSQIAREIAEKCGSSPAEVERVSYAALLHDIHMIAGGRGAELETTQASTVIRDIPLLAEAASVLLICDAEAEVLPSLGDTAALLAFIVALSSDIDAMSCPQVMEAHGATMAAKTSSCVPRGLQARVVGAAVHLGYGVPAIP